jgi:large subunit ribosomal protein L7/L12
MKKADKTEVVSILHERFARARIAIVTECAGMPVNQVNDLRKKLRQAQAQMHVVKNTLAIRALGETSLVSLQPFFTGQSALVIGYDDPVLPAKAIRDFIKAEKCGKTLQVKGAVLDGEALDPARLSAVADLPSKSELLAMLLSAFQGPIRGFVGVLGQIVRSIVAVLAAIQENKTQKGEGEMSATETKMSKEDFIAAIEGLSVLELSDLVKGLEDRFGVTAAAPVGVAVAAPGAGAAEAVEEKTEFDVVLTATAADKKIQAIKVVREITGLGLKEAKDLVEGVPKVVKEGASKEDAEVIQKKLQDVGATVEIK